ncbi:AMP-binding protein [Cupriavidus basilensis]
MLPVNFSMTRGEVEYIVNQSGRQRAVRRSGAGRASRRAALPPAGQPAWRRPARVLAAAQGPGADILATLDESMPAQHPGVRPAPRRRPRARWLTHRALLAEYMSAIATWRYQAGKTIPLAALPLYHSAQMHVFLMPLLLMGGTILLAQSPEPGFCLRTVREAGITSFFAPPTVWIALLRHQDLRPARADLADQGLLRRRRSRAGLPVLLVLRERLPALGFYNCYGQSEIGPLATVLGPEEHRERPALGRPARAQRGNPHRR